MSENSQVEAKLLLDAWKSGDLASRDKLFDLLYTELRQISAALLRAESNNSLSTGDLVNEAVLRLIQLDHIEWADKAHFLALSARAMRRVLIDHARRKGADKRRHEKVTLVTRLGDGKQDRLDLDHLEKALIRLSVIDKSKADIVELRYFGGLTLEEVGEVMGQSESTVKRQWRVARAWLLDAMRDPEESGQGEQE
ncbi:MAG: ECF-type sigma factor [Hyphomonadaceae bacterium]|nr:ECF-type sigma factor [Hyphomonadaceae bacterium]